MSIPKHYPYYAMAGIVDCYFEEGHGDQSFARWVDRWIERSTHSAAGRGYCILDTFLSDSLPSPLLAEMMRTSKGSDSNFRILLADPGSHYAQARAESFGRGSAVSRAERGLALISGAISDLLNVEFPEHPQGQDGDIAASDSGSLKRFNELLEFIHGHSNQASVDLRLYEQGLPSGPMFFLNDFMIYGHHCHGISSRYLPWDVIVDDPDTANDRFDHLRAEYERLWDPERRKKPRGKRRKTARLGQIYTMPTPNHRYFLSYSWQNKVEADQIELGLVRDGRTVGRDSKTLRAGADLNSSIRAQIAESNTLISLWSSGYSESDWATAELDYAMDLLRRGELQRVVLVYLDDTPVDNLRARKLLRLQGTDRQSILEAARKLVEEEE